jgi:AcrR family transcriptional regulator
MPKVTAEHKAAVRDRLLEAAEACLFEGGYEALTTRDILERAGLSAGTLYHYFDGKDDLIAALSKRIADEDLELLNRVETQEQALATVRRILDPANAQSLAPMLRHRAAFDRDIRSALRRFDRTIVEGASRLVPDGAGIDAPALVELVQVVYEGLSARSSASTFVTSHRRVADTFVDLLIRALGSTEPERPLGKGANR